MQTNGQAILLIAMHNMAHCGQLSVSRRVAGFKPLR
jgi:hypothetical protein